MTWYVQVVDDETGEYFMLALDSGMSTEAVLQAKEAIQEGEKIGLP